MKKLLLCLAALAMTAPSAVQADEVFAVTPSGGTEAFFDKSVVATSDYIANQCIDMGWTMMSSTPTMVVCEAPVSLGSALLHAFGGPRYSTPLKRYYRFNLAGANGLTRVQVTCWEETTTAFGQTQQSEIASADYHNAVMFFFANIGGLMPPGTSFPNHAIAGFAAEAVQEPQAGMKVLAIDPTGPAVERGIQVGDVVTRLAGERIRNQDDLLDGLHKATEDEEYEVKLLRDGQELTLQLPVQYREATGPLPEPTWDRDTAPAAAPQVVSAFSIADEIARFAALRDQGILTTEEFEAQKARLLASGN